MTAERVLAFRLARSGLSERPVRTLADAAACPASDFARDAALLALAARTAKITRDAYDAAVDTGGVVVGYAIRGGIHAMAPRDWALFGRGLMADDAEVAAQLGKRAQEVSAKAGVTPVAALAEVTEATRDALAGGRKLDKNDLHEALRKRVRSQLLPWCPGCKSHHVSPIMWRYATVAAGARLDSERRYLLDDPGETPPGSEAVRRFLRFYGPATVKDFGEWAGVSQRHGRVLWDEVADELVEVQIGDDRACVLAADAGALGSSPPAEGIRLLPPGDPYLQKPNRALLAPDPALRKRMFPAIGAPGAVLWQGRLAGLWRMKLKGTRADFAVEELGRFPRAELEAEAERVARVRGAADVTVTLQDRH